MHDDETETTSLREEQGKTPRETPAERTADVPIAPHSAGALGSGSAEELPEGSASDDREAAERRARE